MSNGKETYTQVLLSQHLSPKTYNYQVIWIPTKFAKANRVIEITGNKWKVEEVYSSFSKEHIEKYPDLFRKVFPAN